MSGSSPGFDVKRERRDLYSGRVGRFDMVHVPAMRFLMVDGDGDQTLQAGAHHNEGPSQPDSERACGNP